MENTEGQLTFQLIRVTIDETRFKASSNRQRDQFTGCMHAHNELAFLNRLLLFTINDTGDGELHNVAQFVQLWTVLQLLSGKLCETWKMIVERFLKSNPPDLVARLDASHKESLQWLIDYFGKEEPLKNSALRIVRDKTAFHYDRLNLTEAADNLASSDSCVYLAEHPVNSLYQMGSALVFHAISMMIAEAAGVAGTKEDRVLKGAEIARRDVSDANFRMLAVLYGLIRLLLDDMFGPQLWEPQVRVNILDAPHPSRVGIPAFIDIGSGRKAGDAPG
jgi:hypothetical protein